MAKEQEDQLIDQELRLECLKLARETVALQGALSKEDLLKADAFTVRAAKRYWKFVKNDPLAEKEETDGAPKAE